MSNNVIMLSGGFDPIHVGHLRMVKEASDFGKVIIILNSDEWLQRKKGYVFMPFDERKEILHSIKSVYDVVSVDDNDGTVCEAIKRIKPTHFANGGDRGPENTPEKEVCEKLGVEMLWNIGGKKIQSSSKLTDLFALRQKEIFR